MSDKDKLSVPATMLGSKISKGSINMQTTLRKSAVSGGGSDADNNHRHSEQVKEVQHEETEEEEKSLVRSLSFANFKSFLPSSMEVKNQPQRSIQTTEAGRMR